MAAELLAAGRHTEHPHRRAVPAVDQPGQVRVRSLGRCQVGVGVADQDAPAADPVLEEGDAAGRAERIARLDGEVGAVADVRDDLLPEVAGVDAARSAGPVMPSAATLVMARSSSATLPTGHSAFGRCSVSGRSRRPSPAARITAQTAGHW